MWEQSVLNIFTSAKFIFTHGKRCPFVYLQISKQQQIKYLAKKYQEQFLQWNLLKFYVIAGSGKAD